MTHESTLPFPPPGHPGDLPGHTLPSVATTHTPPLVEPLPNRTAGRALVIVAIGGLVAQVLFYGQFLGVNFPIWVAVVLGAGLLVRRRSADIDRYDLWIPIAALVFAGLCAIRTDGMLLLFNVAAAGTFTLAAIVAFGGQSLTRRSWHSTISSAAHAIPIFLVGATHLGNGFRAFPRSRANRQTTPWRIVRGLAYAAPLLVLFIALFAGADAVFDSILHQALPLDLAPAAVMGRIVIGGAAAWLLGGAIACGWLARQPADAAAGEHGGASGRIGRTEAVVVLASIDMLFLVFVALQAAYLFGGLDTLAASGMTYSDYARRGFGELIAVAVLAGILLVVLGNLVSERGAMYRLLASLLAVMTGFVVVSALMRITLYQQAYGWTELRFYTVAGIGWLAISAVIARRPSRSIGSRSFPSWHSWPAWAWPWCATSSDLRLS